MFLVLFPALSDMVSALSTQTLGTVGSDLLKLVPAYLALMLLFMVQITAVTQSALGLSQSSGWLVFPIGRPLWRHTGAFLLLMLIVIGILIVLGLLAVITSVTVGAGTPWISLVIRLAVDVIILLLIVRLGFFMAPAAIQGPTLGLPHLQLAFEPRKFLAGGRDHSGAAAFALHLFVVELVALFWLMPHMPMPVPGTDPANIGWPSWTGKPAHSPACGATGPTSFGRSGRCSLLLVCMAYSSAHEVLRLARGPTWKARRTRPSARS